MKITIIDNTTFEYGKDINGGSYGYSEVAEVKNGRIVGGGHYTTADFSYCPNCGRFEQNIDRHQLEWNCNKYLPAF